MFAVFQCLECRLEGLECFEGTPFVKQLYKHYLGKHESVVPGLGCEWFIVKWISQDPRLPTVVLSEWNIPLNTILQDYIPICGKMEYPPPQEVTAVSLVSMEDSNGAVWFQEHGDSTLIQVVNRILENSDKDKWTAKPACNEEFQGPGDGDICVAKSPNDEKYYRVKVNLMKDSAFESPKTIKVSRIDYGQDEIDVLDTDLYSAFQINPNLCYIPPQVN